jgi:multimeric flavodoxin WrbA
MKIIGFSAGTCDRGRRDGNVTRMVESIMSRSGHESEMVRLGEKTYSGCKGCVQKCAGPQVCRLEDDMAEYYQKIKEADAVVMGAPVYFDAVNGMAMSFVERFFGYRHVNVAIIGKPFITVVAGAMKIESAVQQLNRMLGYFEVNILDTVTFQSQVPPCFRCGRHRECKIGGLYAMMGDAAQNLQITPEMFGQWEDHADTVEAVDAAAAKLKALAP